MRNFTFIPAFVVFVLLSAFNLSFLSSFPDDSTTVQNIEFKIPEDALKIEKIIGDRPIKISLYLSPNEKEYSERILSCIEHTFHFLKSNLSLNSFDEFYVYSSSLGLTLPQDKTANSVLVDIDLFIPDRNFAFERGLSAKICERYIANNFGRDNPYWVVKGIPYYLASRIVQDTYGSSSKVFQFVRYVPVYGMLLQHYNEIPIIYTVGSFEEPIGTACLETYYNSNKIGSINDDPVLLPDENSIFINGVIKPELMFLTLEKIVGKENLLNAFSKFLIIEPDSAVAEVFWNSLQENSSYDLSTFKENFFYTNQTFDDKIISLKQTGEFKYDVLVERLGSKSIDQDVVLITENDTLWQKWNSSNNWKTFSFITKDKVIAAEIDPYRKNYFDINFTNNSYTIEPRYGASLSIAVRWYFWIQNALMIIGSIG